jgi:hypothetical protein
MTTLNPINHPLHFLGWVNIFEKAALIPVSFLLLLASGTKQP